ncbi:hypothetical protein OCAR_6492 [Afipia carboxidovorans OM5]|uniref:Uncharacterized protein n=1 Tax=Afipia carboxidovorans (strain ATCC 49405 / DSM 1227 / KCTC 32145 / OM5) TaxID=504832 RepID=B6JHR2_AFIC5|nr:hypothetical protein [Afipia carboxidovorans]ACI93605.1 hypothetical protein OCAR_6492 [Afipia carboxidovorans OM5]AEI02703.1 hypothetical protein OCA4_c15640 [Afipia carboxidovorans OM4]AEI06279.1 hypothetical protein OCA5_c15640 [Afipia carboxidovorans OM5]BEV47071.1 hypothetical protein CRBSH125_32540 [Afipia carboxidovorans]
MRALDKKATGTSDGSTSPALIIVALGLFSILVLGLSDPHRDGVMTTLVTIGEFGILPTLAGL